MPSGRRCRIAWSSDGSKSRSDHVNQKTAVLALIAKVLHPHWVAVWLQSILVTILAVCFYHRSSEWMPWIVLLHLATFFATALVCHGELARSRPSAAYLTEFYIWMSVGGVLGGMFNALVAPLVFNYVFEYPLAIALACMLRPAMDDTRTPVRSRWLDLAFPLWLWFVLNAIGRFMIPTTWTSLRWIHPPGDLVSWVGGALILAVTGLMAFACRNWLARAAIIFVVVALAGLAGYDTGIHHRSFLKTWHDNSLTEVLQATALGVGGAICLCFVLRPLRFGMAIGAVLLAGQLWFDRDNDLLDVKRTFFGVLRVENDSGEKTHTLFHGSTIHGVQSTKEIARLEPWTYYHRGGPLGQVINNLMDLRKNTHIGVIGLGTGTTAAYAEAGTEFTYFEIDPAVKQIAENPDYFTYLTDAKERSADIKIVLGDARISLTGQPSHYFDLIVVDAFSSDAIPIHLMTREAMQLYFEKLKPDGILMVHISNRYLRLAPVVGELAHHLGKTALLGDDNGAEEEGKYRSEWVAVANDASRLEPLTEEDIWAPIPRDEAVGLWTDDFSNILAVLTWVRDNKILNHWLHRIKPAEQPAADREEGE